MDDKTYSDQVMHLNIYKKWKSLTFIWDRALWAKKVGLKINLLEGFVSIADNLLKSLNNAVRDISGKNDTLGLHSLDISTKITSAKLNMYRLILTWASAKNIIRQRESRGSEELHYVPAIGITSNEPVDDDFMNKLTPNFSGITLEYEKISSNVFLTIPWIRLTQRTFTILLIFFNVSYVLLILNCHFYYLYLDTTNFKF